MEKENEICVVCINELLKVESNIQKCKKLLKLNYKYDNVKSLIKKKNFRIEGID